jgi:hypothetical protein
MKDEALKLALEALETAWTYDEDNADGYYFEAITAIKQALAAPVQEPVAWMYPDDHERMLTSETFCTVYSVEVGSPTRGESTVALYTTPPAAPVQEPIHQWRQKHSPYWYDGYPDNDDGGGPYETRTLYTTPPAQPAPVQPVASLNEADVLIMAEAHGIDPSTKGLHGFYIDCISTTPPAAQRQCEGCDKIAKP